MCGIECGPVVGAAVGHTSTPAFGLVVHHNVTTARNPSCIPPAGAMKSVHWKTKMSMPSSPRITPLQVG